MLQTDDKSHSMISLPDLSFSEKDVISLTCWQDVSLSDIWIPTRLLPNRKNPSSSLATHGIFHTLEKRDNAKKIESFSTYSDSDNESEADIFQSDSDDTFDLDSISNEFMKIENDLHKPIEINENSSVLKPLPVKSDVSLNEIINSNVDVDITSFEFQKNTQHINEEEKSQSNKSNSKKKFKKVTRSVTLDQFLENYTEENKQEACANDYLQKVLAAKNKEGEDEIQLKNNFEFPDLNLPLKEIKFIHSEKTNEAKPEINIKTVTELLSEPDKNEEDINNCAEIALFESENNLGKIAVENIPVEVSHEDIYTILSDYGEIKDFTLEPDGDFVKALLKINLIGDIDWIVDCLNGSELFGASSRALKCYKVL